MTQLWYGENGKTAKQVFRPAALIECRLGFRSIRAGFQHTEERFYAAWYPKKGLSIDWAESVVKIASIADLSNHEPQNAQCLVDDHDFSAEAFKNLEEELIDYLNRRARFSVLYNANFQLYSEPAETTENYHARVSEAALQRLEPELKRLLKRFEMGLEQLREAQTRRGRKLEGDEAEMVFTRWREVFAASENRLAEMFASRGGFMLAAQPLPDLSFVRGDDAELLEELQRVQTEAQRALNDLHSEYLRLMAQCDDFEVGLQRDNLIVLRRAVLWVAGE